MIYFLNGDAAAISDFVSKEKSKEKYTSTLEIELSESNLEPLEFVLSPSFFIDKKLLVVFQKVIKPSKILINNISDLVLQCLANNVDMFVIDFPFGQLNKDLVSKVKNIVFDAPKDDFSFKLCDELFINNNKKNAISTIINNSEFNEGDFYKTVGLIQTYLRLLLSAKYNSQTILKQNKWFANKIIMQKDKFSIEKIQGILNELLKLDIKSKSYDIRDNKMLLADFVLYSF